MAGALTRMLGRGSSGAASDPYWSNVVLLCGFEGTNGSTTFTDESPVGRTLTANGNAQISTAQFKYGSSSLLLDGTGDFVSAVDSADWDFGSGQFTIEAFVRRQSGENEWTIASQWSATAGAAAWAFFITLGGLYFRFYDTGGTLRDTGPVAYAPTASTWAHVAVDRDASNKVRLYSDGSMIASATYSQTIRNGATDLRIGATQGFSLDFNGNMDEVRITKGVARYASDSGFTVPSAAYPRS